MKQVKLQLRLSEALRKKLKRAAIQNRRSMNAEIIYALEQGIKDARGNGNGQGTQAVGRRA